jgi:hypothetical protein
MEAGANEQLRFAGRPVQVSPTALLNEPELGVTVTVNLLDPPESIVTAAGFVPRVRPPLPVCPPQFNVILTAIDI